MIPTTNRGGLSHDPGIAKMKEAVHKRMAYVGVEQPDRLIDDHSLERICAVSGGYVRGLMTLMRTTMNYVNDFPITSKAVEQAICDARDAAIRATKKPEHWKILRDVTQRRATTETEDYLQLLDSDLVFEYRDDDGPWYDVNPLVREAREFK